MRLATRTIGLYHLRWEVETIAKHHELRKRLDAAGVRVGTSDHGTNQSLCSRDHNALEFELVPPGHMGEGKHEAIIAPLDLAGERRRFAGHSSS